MKFRWLHNAVEATAHERTTTYRAPGGLHPSRWAVSMDPGFEGVLRALAIPCPTSISLIDVLRISDDEEFRRRVLAAHDVALCEAERAAAHHITLNSRGLTEDCSVYGVLWDLSQQSVEAREWLAQAASALRSSP